MFEKLFKYTGKALIYIMFVMLILSFGAWGIGDILRGTSHDTAAVVAGQKITNAYIDSLVSERKTQIMQSTKRTELPEEFSAVLKSSILRQVINQILFENETKKLGIIVDGKQAFKAEIAKQKDLTKEKFQNFLRSTNQSEDKYISDLGQQKAIDYVEYAISANAPVSEYLVNKASSFQSEKRSYQYVEVTPAAIKQVANPTKADLESFYADKKQQFALPEQRSAKILVIDANSINGGQSNLEKVESYANEPGDLSAGDDNISEELYATANAAMDKLAEGKNFEDIAKELNLKIVNVNNIDTSGNQDASAKVTLPNVKDLLKNIFNAEQGKASELLEDEKGKVFAILQVDAITPARERTIDEVLPELTRAWQFENVRKQLEKLANEVAEKAAKTGLENTAKEYGLAIKTSENINRTSTEIASGLLDEIFTNDDKSKTTKAYANNSGNYIVARLSNIVPANVDALELYSVKAALQEQMKDDYMTQYMVYLASKNKVKISK